VDGIRQSPETGYKAIVIDAKLVRHTPAAGIYGRVFNDDQPHPALGAPSPIGNQLIGHLVIGRSIPGIHRRHNDPVSHRHAIDGNGLKNVFQVVIQTCHDLCLSFPYL
jgi:hypothetical protein